MSPKLPAVNCKDIIKIIERKGFRKVRQSGSHAIFRNDTGLRTTIPIHSKKTFGKGLLKQIMKDCDLTSKDFE